MYKNRAFKSHNLTPPLTNRYRTTPEIMTYLKENVDLLRNLSAAAHLIHGSSEGRFTVTWCPGFLTQEEIEGVGYEYAPLAEMEAPVRGSVPGRGRIGEGCKGRS